MEWTFPTTWNLVWPAEQRLPDPCREIDQREFNELMFCGSYSLEGIGFNSLFLDWGKGWLIEHPRTATTWKGENYQYTGRGGWDGLQNMWSVSFFWFPDYGVAVAKRYSKIDDFVEFGKLEKLGHLAGVQYLPGMGIWEPMNDRWGNGHVLRFFKLGCDHDWVEQGGTPMFEHLYICSKCRSERRTDSS